MIRELLLKDFSLWGVAWQSTLFAVIGLVGSFLLRRRPSRSCQVLFLALIAAVLVPTMSILVKHLEVGLFAAEPTTLKPDTPNEVTARQYEAPAALPRTDIPGDVQAGIGEPAGTKAASGSINVPWRTIAVYGWMGVAFILMGRLLVAFIGGIHLLRQAQLCGCEQVRRAADSARTRIGMVKGLQIRSSKGLRSPVIWCWSRPPVLLVPADLDCAVDWVGVISHEIAHCKRWDHLGGLIAELVVCILPWNPLLWWCKKRMVRLSEQACDDWVVEGGQPGTEYAQSLLNLSPEVQMAFLPTVIGKEKPMKERICRIVREKCGEPRVGARWVLAVTAIAVSLAVGAAFAQRRPAGPGSPEQDERLVTTDRERDVPPERRAELAGRERQIRAEIAQTEKELAGLEDQQRGQSDDAHALRRRVQELSEQMQVVRQQLEGFGRERRELESRERPEIEGRARELARHLGGLEADAHAKELALRRLEEQDKGNTDEAHAIRRQLEEVRQRIQAAQEERASLERGGLVNGEIQVELELSAHPEARVQRRQELRERARQIEVELREVGDRYPEKAQKLQVELRAIRGQVEQVEREPGSPRRQAVASRLQQPVVRVDSDEARVRTQRRLELQEQIRRLERQLEELGPEHPEEAGELQVQLERTHEQIQRIERESNRLEHPTLRLEAALQPGAEVRHERVVVEADRGGVSQDRPPVRERQGLEREVSELRGQMDRLSAEMRELRELMKQLLEQRGPREPM
jgi:beta-lactamase regulating signal transducer with metallopeptidase domain/predicted  nucleic acid-binding Zn-ribbon protein